jgi:hypothetical protein
MSNSSEEEYELLPTSEVDVEKEGDVPLSRRSVDIAR